MPAPKIVTAAAQGLVFEHPFGQLGPELYVTGHHTAGPKDKTDAHAAELNRIYHRMHKDRGWGGEGYHYNITRRGTLMCLRPTISKGAHVGGANSNNVGVMFHGTTGDRPTFAQAKAYRWLLKNAHTAAMPKAHRTDNNLWLVPRKGHNDWSGHRSNACPGTHKHLIVKARRSLADLRAGRRG